MVRMFDPYRLVFENQYKGLQLLPSRWLAIHKSRSCTPITPISIHTKGRNVQSAMSLLAHTLLKPSHDAAEKINIG